MITRDGHSASGTHRATAVAGPNSATDHYEFGIQLGTIDGGPTSPTASEGSSPTWLALPGISISSSDHLRIVTHPWIVAAVQSPSPPTIVAAIPRLVPSAVTASNPCGGRFEHDAHASITAAGLKSHQEGTT